MAQNKTKPLSKSAKKRTSKIKSKASRERVVGSNTDADKKVKARGRVKALQTKKVKQRARKSKTPKIKFKPGDHVVYPTHGVGSVQGIERETVGGIDLNLVVISRLNRIANKGIINVNTKILEIFIYRFTPGKI